MVISLGGNDAHAEVSEGFTIQTWAHGSASGQDGTDMRAFDGSSGPGCTGFTDMCYRASPHEADENKVCVTKERQFGRRRRQYAGR